MRSSLWLAGLVAITLAIGCNDDGGDDGGTDPTGGPLDAVAVYNQNCAGCHGADGSGATGPNLNERVPQMTAQELKDNVRNGASGMPPFSAAQISDAELDALVQYLQDTYTGS